LNIAFVSWHCCTRVMKIGLALMKAGHNVHYVQSQISNPDFMRLMKSCSFFENQEDFQIKMEGLEGIDLVHVHNEPSWLGWLTKAIRPDLPIVFDAHDLTFPRYGEASTDDIQSIGRCDGVLVPSKTYLQHVTDYYWVNKPVELIYSYCNKNVIGLPELPKIPGIVYEGGMNVATPEEAAGGKQSFRDFRRVARVLTQMNILFAMYSPDPKDTGPYAFTGALIMPYAPYFTMMRELTRYDWGFCGSPYPTPALDWAMPNKLFEYVAAGLPVIIHHGAEMAEFVREHELGIVIESLDEVSLRYEEYKRFKPIVRDKRWQFTMESQVDKLMGFYRKVQDGN